jgi:PhzF family phenazine biosynthesis protein
VSGRRFAQVDVFGAEPLRGNPVAVILDADGLSDEDMQRVALWTNLSETTFLLPPTMPGADYRLRIFTPARELTFAGHPTLGSCHAWLEAGGRPHAGDMVTQECGAGLVPIRRRPQELAFAAPRLVRTGPVEPEVVARVALALGLSPGEVVEHQWVDNGPGWVAVLVRSAERVLSIEPDYARMTGLEVGVVGPYAGGAEPHFEVRAFVTEGAHGGFEDPVTGSLNASLGQWLIGAGLAPPRYVASQGLALGRAGRVSVERDGGGHVWLGGATRTVVGGTIGW